MSDKSESADVLSPGPDAKAEPYWAIMEVDEEGFGTGTLFTHGGKILLFDRVEFADRLLDALSKQDANHSFAVRGVTAPHLQEIMKIAGDKDLELWVVTNIADDGNVVARPLRTSGS